MAIKHQTDEAFNAIYKEEMQKFKQQILNDNDFASKYGDLGNVYGKQWRDWEDKQGNHFDQLKTVIDQIKITPILVGILFLHGIRLKLIQWLCAMSYNVHPYVQDGKLSCQLYQRSGYILRCAI